MLSMILTALALAANAANEAPRDIPPSRSISLPVRWTPSAISTDDYESTPTFSPDGKTLVYMLADPTFRRYTLRETHCIDGQWTPPVAPSFAADPAIDDADPGFTPDGSQLYFVSARHRFATAGNDDLDIFVVTRDTEGHWGTPERLPEPVNSTGAELLPRVDEEGNLYFGSDRPGGLGQSDIYRARRDAEGQWQVTNLGTDINSPAAEFEAEVSRDGRTLVVVSGLLGHSHLFRYQREGERWRFVDRIPADEEQHQVGPLLSPSADHLLFAQKTAISSGEIFLATLAKNAPQSWPFHCGD